MISLCDALVTRIKEAVRRGEGALCSAQGVLSWTGDWLWLCVEQRLRLCPLPGVMCGNAGNLVQCTVYCNVGTNPARTCCIMSTRGQDLSPVTHQAIMCH